MSKFKKSASIQVLSALAFSLSAPPLAAQAGPEKVSVQKKGANKAQRVQTSEPEANQNPIELSPEQLEAQRTLFWNNLRLDVQQEISGINLYLAANMSERLNKELGATQNRAAVASFNASAALLSLNGSLSLIQQLKELKGEATRLGLPSLALTLGQFLEVTAPEKAKTHSLQAWFPTVRALIKSVPEVAWMLLNANNPLALDISPTESVEIIESSTLILLAMFEDEDRNNFWRALNPSETSTSGRSPLTTVPYLFPSDAQQKVITDIHARRAGNADGQTHFAPPVDKDGHVFFSMPSTPYRAAMNRYLIDALSKQKKISAQQAKQMLELSQTFEAIFTRIQAAPNSKALHAVETFLTHGHRTTVPTPQDVRALRAKVERLIATQRSALSNANTCSGGGFQ